MEEYRVRREGKSHSLRLDVMDGLGVVCEYLLYTDGCNLKWMRLGAGEGVVWA